MFTPVFLNSGGPAWVVEALDAVVLLSSFLSSRLYHITIRISLIFYVTRRCLAIVKVRSNLFCFSAMILNASASNPYWLYRSNSHHKPLLILVGLSACVLRVMDPDMVAIVN